MKYLDFQQVFQSVPIIPVSGIELHFPGFDRNNLSRWQEKGYIEKLRNGMYRLRKPLLDQEELFLIAGRLYGPSCISLESALSWYGLIPEGVFSITSVSNLKTRQFDTPIGRFTYRHLKKDLLFGSHFIAWGPFQYKMADPVKALLDLFYLRADLKTSGQLEELRLDLRRLKAFIEEYPLEQYLAQFDSVVLTKKIRTLQKMLP